MIPLLRRLLWWRQPVDRGTLDMTTWHPTPGTRYDHEGNRY